MKHRIATKDRVTRRRLPRATATALALALTLTLAQASAAKPVTPPPVPAEIEVDVGSRAFFEGHAVGTQNYVCLPSPTGVAWTLFTPVATLFNDHDKQLTTHFFSPNPFESGTVRPAWQHSRDTSTVWGRLNTPSSDSAFVAPGAIPWLLIDVVGAGAGPHGGNVLTRATQIHRINTFGGVAPATGCSASADVGNKAFVPYTADYIFYTQPESDGGEDE